MRWGAQRQTDRSSVLARFLTTGCYLMLVGTAWQHSEVCLQSLASSRRALPSLLGSWQVDFAVVIPTSAKTGLGRL